MVRLALRLAGSAEGLTLDEIAHELSVSRRTAERMRDTVRDLFPGFDFSYDGPHLRFFIRGGLAPFLTSPSAVELAEFDAQIRALEQAGHLERAQILRKLEGKVRAALRDSLKARAETDLDVLRRVEAIARQVGPRSVSDPGVIALLREALLAMRKVRFTYSSPDQVEPTMRVVVPYGLLFGRNAYLVGHQEPHGQPVLWRLDRMNRLAIVDALAKIPPTFSLDAYAQRSIGTFQENSARITLRFLPAAATEARRMLFHPTQTMRDLQDGSVEVAFTAGGLLELAHHLFTWGDGVEIVEPAALRSLMVRELEQALAHHRSHLE